MLGDDAADSTGRSNVDADTVEPNPTTGARPEVDRLLDLVWRRHRQWSIAANTARRA